MITENISRSEKEILIWDFISRFIRWRFGISSTEEKKKKSDRNWNFVVSEENIFHFDFEIKSFFFHVYSR